MGIFSNGFYLYRSLFTPILTYIITKLLSAAPACSIPPKANGMKKNPLRTALLSLTVAAIATSASADGDSGKTVVPLFLFSGQSNMVGLGTNTSQLSQEEREDVENIKIYQESEGAHKGEWLTLGPGFGGSNSQFGVELFFGRVLADTFPDKKMAFIKDAVSGTFLGQSGGWLPPSSGGPGTLYANMMNHIEDALESFNDAFDTSEYVPRWAGFIWHQGEFDAWNDRSLAEKYEENLTNLISDIRAMTKDENLPVIIPMIANNSTWQHNAIVREAEITVAANTENCDTTDTKDFPLATDGVHYNTESMKRIGTTCAIRWLAMDYIDDWWDTIPVPVTYRPGRKASPSCMTSVRALKTFDLSGRVVGASRKSSAMFRNSQVSPLLLIETGDFSTVSGVSRQQVSGRVRMK